MQIETVTSTGANRNLLPRVRQTLAEAERSLMCVAFVHPRGLYLLQKELEQAKRRTEPPRLLLTTTFQGDTTALSTATQLGVQIKVLNPGSGSTFHPKVYLGQRAGEVQAVIGSANLTGGLASNVEAGVWMKGTATDAPLRHAWEWAEELWRDPRAELWQPTTASESAAGDLLEPQLFAQLLAEVERNPVFLTLGLNPRKNRVVAVTQAAVLVETERSMQRTGGPQPIPATMFNLAWDYLRAHGRLSNSTLLNELRVHRSSAVCAILARLPSIRQLPGRGIELGWEPWTRMSSN